MKPKPPTTEDLLKTGKGISLSSNERTAMKAELLAYARYHGESSLSPAPATALFWWWRSTAVLASSLLLVVGTGYASTYSLPGETLYAVKVNVVEKAIDLTKISETAELQYVATRYQTRLAEIQTLARRDELDEAALADVTPEIKQLVAQAGTVIRNDTDESIADKDVLGVTTELVALSEAVSDIVDETVSAAAATSFDDTADDARTIHRHELAEFVASSSPEAVGTYIAAQLDTIDAALLDGSLPATTTEMVTNYLEDTQDALEAADYGAAVTNVSEAVQEVKTESYNDVRGLSTPPDSSL